MHEPNLVNASSGEFEIDDEDGAPSGPADSRSALDTNSGAVMHGVSTACSPTLAGVGKDDFFSEDPNDQH